jgi:hypothetical protein
MHAMSHFPSPTYQVGQPTEQNSSQLFEEGWGGAEGRWVVARGGRLGKRRGGGHEYKVRQPREQNSTQLFEKKRGWGGGGWVAVVVLRQAGKVAQPSPM